MALERLTDKLLSQSPLISYGKLGFWGRQNFWRDQLDLSDRTIVVTGATSGIGKAAALEMAKIGANLILVGRNQKKLETVKQIIEDLHSSEVNIFVAELSEVQSCIQVCDKILDRTEKIDGLVNNAGAMFKQRKVNSKGIELTFATNVLSGFILTNKLIPILSKSDRGRIVHVSSGGMYLHRLEPDDLNFDRRSYKDLSSYAQSKRAQVILNELWAQKISQFSKTLRTDCMHPGWVETPGLDSSMPRFSQYLNPILRDPKAGADTIVWLCAANEISEANGSFWFDRKTRDTHVSKKTHNTEPEKQALWHYCVNETGVDFPKLR